MKLPRPHPLSRIATALLLLLACLANSEENVVYHTVYACQNQVLTISCLENYAIKIVRANYGRFSIAICNEVGRTDFSVNCQSPKTLGILQKKCDGRRTCSAASNSSFFENDQDPCPSTGKYLEAQFYCSSSSINPDFLPTSEASISSTEEEKKSSTKRIPITPRPTLRSQNQQDLLTTSMTTASHDDLEAKIKPNEITTKFLSSSIASTNIMDTSDLPVTMVTTTTTTLRTTPTTGSTTTTTTTASTASRTSTTSMETEATSRRILGHLESNKPYPVLIFEEKPRVYDKHPEKCNRELKAGLYWPLAEAGETQAVHCGTGLAGMAFWPCNSEGQRVTEWPDLSQCQSLWLQKLRAQLDKQASIVHVANDLAHYSTTFGPLSPGDLLLLVDTIEVMTVKMRADLKTIPTQDQRRAVITEVVQDILKTISMTVDLEINGVAWERLGGEAKKRKCVTLMINALENAGLLLPEVVHENKEVTVATPNILMSVKGINFGHMSKLRLPSEAALASENWSNFSNSVLVPSLDLMEHMQRGGEAQIIFLSIKSLQNLLPPPENMDGGLKVISNLISLTMGEKLAKFGLRPTKDVRLNQPLSIHFVHPYTSLDPTCAFWDTASYRWNTRGCKLIASNGTHSQCGCISLATFALLAPSGSLEGYQSPGVTTDVLYGILAAFLLLLAILAIVILSFICSCSKRKALLCCHPLRLLCNGLLQSIKNYLCCRSIKHIEGNPMMRSSSFAPERIYELHDATPTFYPQHHPIRGDEAFFTMPQSPPNNIASRRGLTLDLPKSIWPSRDIVATPERPLLTDLPSPEFNVYQEVDLEYQQPIHRPLQMHSTGSSSSGYGSGSYDNVRGAARGPFVSYNHRPPILRPF